MDLHTQGLDIVGAVGSAGEIRQVELDLVPSLVETHRHRADEGLHTGGALIVARTESTSDILVVEDLDFEGEIFLKVLDDHDKEGQLDAQSLVCVCGTGDIVS